MKEKELVNEIKVLLKTDFDLSFLLTLERVEIETLVASIGASTDNAGG